MKNDKGGSILLHVLTPVITAAVCLGAVILAAVPFSDKLKVYKNLVFMDDLKLSPDSADSGLVIRENDISTEHSGEYSDTGEIIRPVFAEQYAVLSCSSLGNDVPVYWGSSRELFELGACQSSGSVLPGEDGNTVISAHEDTFFSDLSKLKEGDTVTIYTKYGEFTYTVTKLIEFKRTQNKYVVPSKESKLTLYTCKKDVLGSSDDRIGVICEPAEKKFYKEAE
ncbi:MAG: class D sortase [Ruminococcus sp.]|nr:class D sortase [Ruminococcus sp.]